MPKYSCGFAGGASPTLQRAAKPRAVRDLLAAAEDRAEERRRQERERATHEKARREREEAAARELRLNALAKREEEAWRQVGALIATKQPKNYDEAIVLLRDLRDCAFVPAGKSRPRHVSKGCSRNTQASGVS